MVIAYHLVWTGYGWWLPNDPRGSMSRAIASTQIAELGPMHYGRKRVQPAGVEVRRFYDRAAEVLKFPLLKFDEEQIETIGAAFAETVREHRFTCYACAVMPDHVHILIRKHRHTAEEMIDNFQRVSRVSLIGSETIDLNHPVWTQGGWKGFLDTPADVRRTIRYIELNPENAGRPRQHWPFVIPYDNWPFHKKRARSRSGPHPR